MTTGYPALGELLGPYRVGRRLGGGGMGVVFAATDETLRRPVALKVISPHLADDPGFRARFTREAQAQASLDSEHVVRVFAHGESGGRLWIATQLVPDGDLGHLLHAHGAPPVRTALVLIAQVASGLADAHAAGLVHRDIKPANVLLRRGDGQVRAYLADFGIARLVGDGSSATVHTVGTPAWMAPELHTGGMAGVASDVYSLGCLLWATLTARAPYSGTSDFQVVTAHREQPVPQLPGTGPLVEAVNAVLRTAMAKRPDDRFPSATAMRDALRAAVALPEAAPAPSRRTTLVAAAAVALLLVGGGGVAWAASRGDGPTRPPSTGSTASASPAADRAAEQRATAGLAQALAARGDVTPAQARCVARDVIRRVGLEEMVADGLFDARMNYLDRDLAPFPAVAAAVVRATVACR
ncbi:serine/threonine-protein kinase [Nocardioides sp. LS1]|uniref:serine/threonine-protein kinase n=1 Tax=Nocardioides sp. LS1 TaxID=1027620 RepID=UPI000F622CC9|nr:serine/threonine-protein kinase [Nocardioides sp. LS1]GCD90421.1 hypothetical protein NLS1_24270 [Nocardioides sp. LS1]